MNFLSRFPQEPPLAETVESIFDLKGYQPGHRRERIVPDGRMHLIIELDGNPRHIYDKATGKSCQTCQGAWLSGVHSEYFCIGDLSQESRLLAIQFAPGGSAPFTQRSAEEFCERVVPAESVFGAAIHDLRTQLLGLGDPNERLLLAESWLTERYAPSFETPAFLQAVLDELLKSPGEVRLTEFVKEQGAASYKHFVDCFRRQVGPSPKVMQRILRFASVFARLEGRQDVNWAELSAELGFADQAHFIREFRAFSGYAPQEFQAQEHNRVNFFPDDVDDGHH